MVEFFYVLFAVECRKLDDAEVKRKFQKFNIDYPQHKWDFNQFKEFEEQLTGYPIDIAISREEIGFFEDEEEAKKSARANIVDYNDGGCYNYGMVVKVPFGSGYPYYSEYNEFWLFKFNPQTRTYEDEDFDADEFTRSIRARYDTFA